MGSVREKESEKHMKITIMKNMKGLIHGSDPKRIGCATDGVLKIGTTEVSISSNTDSVMPVLCHGGTCEYDATFTTNDGKVYDLERVVVKGGRITPPSPTAVEIMELRCRADAAEAECEALRSEIRILKNIFDTDSLNFLIR